MKTAGFRNVHFAPPPDAAPAEMPRLRRVTNSPAREYSERPGQVERLPDALAAIILSVQRWATVCRDQVEFQVDKVKHTFFSFGSVTCRTKDGERVLICFNRHNMDCIHVLDEQGGYVETLQRKGKAEFFNAEANGRELAKHRAAQARMVTRMEEVHGKDTLKQLREARENTETMRRVVATLPAAVATETAAAAPRAQPVADALARGGKRKGARSGDNTTALWANGRAGKTTRAAEPVTA